MKLVRNLSLAVAVFVAAAPSWSAQHDGMQTMTEMMVDRLPQTLARP